MAANVQPELETVAAVIVTRNRRENLRHCLETLLAQTYPLSAVFVVDNSSTDGTAEMVKGEFSPAIYHRLPDNVGSGGGYRTGLGLAFEEGASWLWAIDDEGGLGPGGLGGGGGGERPADGRVLLLGGGLRVLRPGPQHGEVQDSPRAGHRRHARQTQPRRAGGEAPPQPPLLSDAEHDLHPPAHPAVSLQDGTLAGAGRPGAGGQGDLLAGAAQAAKDGDDFPRCAGRPAGPAGQDRGDRLTDAVTGVLQVIQQGQLRGAEVFALDLARELAAGWRALPLTPSPLPYPSP